MSAELRVTFLGEPPDARKAVAGLDRLLQVIGAVEATTDKGGGSTWRFTRLGLGSVDTGVAVLAPRAGASVGDVEAALPRVLDGFVEAEEHEGIPAGWSKEVATWARDLLRTQDEGLAMELREDDHLVRSARITRVAQRHLEIGLETSARDSIGSVVGQLDSVSVHDRFEARLWPERGGNAVPVRFEAEDVETVKEHLGKRVEASGRIRRDDAGQLISVRLKSLEPLPTFEESPALSDLIGLDPGFTGGLSASDYLREARGEAK